MPETFKKIFGIIKYLEVDPCSWIGYPRHGLNISEYKLVNFLRGLLQLIKGRDI